MAAQTQSRHRRSALSAVAGLRPKVAVKAVVGTSTNTGPMNWSKNWRFESLHDCEPMARVELVKRGVPASVAATIARRMGISKERMYATLGLSRATVERKVRESKPLSADESSRVLGVGSLVGQVQRMVEESGNPAGFDAAQWLARWLDEPLAALAGMRPAELMDTAEGQAIVARMLSRAQSGAFS